VLDRPNFSIEGRVALLTGAGRGIGLAMAQALASGGAAVVIQDIDRDVAESEAESIRKSGAKALALGGDICDVEAAPAWVDQTIKHFGGIHILVNNAAIQSVVHWQKQPIDEMQRQFNANLFTPIRLCQQAVPHFRAQKWGRVINLGSIQQRRGNPTMLAYSLTKSAIDTFTKALARDVAGDEVTANLVAPGYFNTYRNRDHLKSPADVEEAGKRNPMKRLGEPRDCAGVALLLCSDAGAYITGQTIFVDGGLSA
jgi:NAD(P)-dependent dehydrogenase (short-subunit alcohol dehydrogenase family)